MSSLKWFCKIILLSLAPGKLISHTLRKKKTLWEPGAQQTGVIITSVQADCHIWHRGAENRRGTAEKTKSVRLHSLVCFSAKIHPARMMSMLRHGGKGRLGFTLWLPAAVLRTSKAEITTCHCRSKHSKAKASVSFDQRASRVATCGFVELSLEPLVVTVSQNPVRADWKRSPLDEPQNSEI